MILSDEVYSWILYGGREHVSLLSYPEIRNRLILLEGWSKTYAMTGWRIGYGVFPPDLFPHVERLAVNSYSCVNAPTQHAAVAALEGPDDDIQMMVKAFDERRQLIVRELNEVPGFTCVDPGGAFYAFIKVPEHLGITGTQFAERAIERSLLTIPGGAFSARDTHFRISFATNRAKLTQGLDILAELMQA